MQTTLEKQLAAHPNLQTVSIHGRITEITARNILISGLSGFARMGDQIRMSAIDGTEVMGEVIKIDSRLITISAYGDASGLRIDGKAFFLGQQHPCPTEEWVGHVLDHAAQRIDGKSIPQGDTPMPLKAVPPKNRKSIGGRLHTGIAPLDSFLPLCRGQRIGLFAGSGVGKSTLLADLAKGQNREQSDASVEKVDIVILALIGERGREIRDFTHDVLGTEGMRKSIVFAATSDEAPALKLRAAWLAMACAEYFRDQGKHVLLLFDSLTRFAQAHRSVALSAGETPSLHAFPPSTFAAIAKLCERAGPGRDGDNNIEGDITAAFSVLVAGSNMEEPVADMVRGILDGHVVLDRRIAERGRFPAIDISRSVSRSLPGCASEDENQILMHARRIIGSYEKAETLISAGLYQSGNDPVLDEAVQKYGAIDEFMTHKNHNDLAETFESLAQIFAPQMSDTHEEHKE